MPYYKFKEKDILRNTLKTRPEFKFSINDGTVYLNNQNAVSGAHVNNVPMIPTGYVSLYELNVDRASGNKIYPFVVKDSNLTSIGTVTQAGFNSSFEYGDVISGSYPLSASITRERFVTGHGDTATSHLSALKNTLDSYAFINPNYQYSSSLGNKAQQEVNLISIPSIFFDSGIRPGSVDLKFYISGTLVARAQDKHKNGSLVQTGGTAYAQTNGSDSVAGVGLYNQGFIILTGSWDLTEASFDFGVASRQGQWCDFASGANDGSDSSLTPSASFQLKFEGTNEVSTITMHAIAPKGLLNYSNNPTFKSYESASVASSNSSAYTENISVPIKNTISSSFCDYSASFKKQTFIDKIGIYDDDKNLIAIAKLAKPVKKTEDRALTFRLKLDI